MKYVLTIAALLALLTNASAQSHTDSLPKGWWEIPKSNVRIKFGGYIKADLIHDFNPIGSPDFFDVTKIPTDGSEGQTTHFNVKETRMLVDVRTPSKIGEIRAYVESDFYGSSGAFRIRHAFIDIDDKLMVGQYWSNFMDENIIPNTLDFEKPSAYAFVRHGLIRYKQKLSPHSYLAFALEEPSTSAEAPTVPGKFESPLPDFTARYRYTGKWGHVQLSAFAAMLRYRYNTGGTDDLGLFGLNLSGQFNVFKKDYLTYQIVGGPGSGRYRGGMAAAPDAANTLQTLDDMGWTITYCHYWTPSLSSLLVYNAGRVNTTAAQPGSTIKNVQYVAANLIWQFAPQTWAGVEYLWGNREDKDASDGQANRIQFSIRHSFNL